MSKYSPDPDQGVFGISVVAELSGVGIQVLRGYEDKGLLEPSRTDGGTRRYSPNDVERVEQIIALAEQGVNLAGIGHILALQAETTSLRHQLDKRTSHPRGGVTRDHADTGDKGGSQ